MRSRRSSAVGLGEGSGSEEIRVKVHGRGWRRDREQSCDTWFGPSLHGGRRDDGKISSHTNASLVKARQREVSVWIDYFSNIVLPLVSV